MRAVHSKGHHLRAASREEARQAAHRGYLAICVEQIGYGERGERDLPKKSPDRTIDVAVHAVLLGQSLQGLKTMDVSAAIDWLESPEAPFEIDRDRIFLFGHSSGGTTAQYAAALDPRIKGVLASGSVRRVREITATRGNANGEYAIPSFLTQFESDDIVALVAPRPFIGLSGSNDHIFPFDGVERVVEDIARAGGNRITRPTFRRSRDHALRRRRPQEGHPATGPTPRRPPGQVKQLRRRTHPAKFHQLDQPNAGLGLHLDGGDPAVDPPACERNPNHRPYDDPLRPPVGLPGCRHDIVERSIDADDVGQHAHDPPLRAGRLDIRWRGRLVAELQPSLVGLAQRPRADVRSSTLLVCSHGNVPASGSRPK